MEIENFRAWFDERDVGPLQRSCPFQSNVICQAVQPTFERQLLIDNEILNICLPMVSVAISPTSTSTSTSTLNSNGIVESSSMSISFNPEEIALEIINNLPPPRPMDSIHPRNIFELLELSNDLKVTMTASTSNNQSTTETAVRQNPESLSLERNLPPSKHTAESKETSSSKQSKEIKPNVEVSSKFSLNKKNPFKSAKEQFGDEGGELAPAKATTKTTTMKSVLGSLSNVNSTSKSSSSSSNSTSSSAEIDSTLPEALQHFDKNLIQKLESDIWQEKGKTPITFRDIAGLDFAKKNVQELVCWPMMRPDLFTGLRALPKGLLLFGPPGTGKTLIGKAIANQIGATFFCISASSLTSKWVGESESAVRALFALGVHHQPSIIFIDEIDSLLTQRSSDESEASRRIKTEFLVQLDGASTNNDAMVVVIGATNRPEELDEAARRRFVKRLYIPLPDEQGRKQLISTLLQHDQLGSLSYLTENEIDQIVEKTQGFSGADLRALCTEAALGPVREVTISQVDLNKINLEDVPPISFRHFTEALGVVSPSVSGHDLQKYVNWNIEFGSYRRME